MRILVLGGYGLIGLAITRRLLREGFGVAGLARSERRGRAVLPGADWIEADLARLTKPQTWRPHLTGIDAVVNAAGVLQSGLGDNVVRVQRDAVTALIAACESEGVATFVQISAPGASANSDTEFYRSKAAADAALRNSRLNWTIFRPGLVLSPHANGGTSLLRMLAAFPFVQPLVMADARIQTVAVDDVADAVAEAVVGKYPNGDFDLVEAEPHSLESLVLRLRAWLGFKPPRAVIRMPRALGLTLAVFADAAGWLGWRSALRSTALKVLTDDVLGDGEAWTKASGRPLISLDETLRSLPSTAQERMFARSRLVFPALLIILAGFWIVSGMIGLIELDSAARMLIERLGGVLARMTVIAGALADMAIGVAMLMRPFVRPACAAAVALSLVYLAGAALFAPGLWVDPSGPMIKVLPAIALTLAVMALAERG